MRISDWSSDVCSSDLVRRQCRPAGPTGARPRGPWSGGIGTPDRGQGNRADRRGDALGIDGTAAGDPQPARLSSTKGPDAATLFGARRRTNIGDGVTRGDARGVVEP